MKCKRCGEEYEPQYIECMSIHILRGNGNCHDCAGKIWAEIEAREQAEYEQDIRNRRSKSIASSGIPRRFLTESFSSFDKGYQDKALKYCQQYADDFPIDKRPIGYPSLYLWSKGSAENSGGNGTGKTHLSCAIANRIFERWNGGDRGCPRIYFVSEPDFFRQIQATYSYNSEEKRERESEDDILKRLTYCALLILDDVGKERRGDPRFIQRTLFGLIDGRYKLQLPIVLTANVNADGLKAHLEGASFDRFFEMIEGKSVCMDGESYRRRQGK